jgi:hypothetical protein
MMFSAKVGLTLALISALSSTGFSQCGANGSNSTISLNNAAPFSISDRGTAVYDTTGSGSSLTTGYAAVQANAGSTTPAGYLTFSFTQDGVLVSRVTVPEVRPISDGRLYAAYYGSVNTGIAMVNPNSVDAVVQFYFTPGSSFCDCPNPEVGTFILPAHSQIARFINESPFSVSFGPAIGSMTFTSSVPIGVMALLSHTNQRGEILMTALPISDFEQPAGNDAVIFPHYADGGGWTTQVILVNPADVTLTGAVQFLGPGGTTSRYSISGRDVVDFATPGLQATVTTGAVRVIPDAGSFSPAGLTIFTLTTNGIVVSETGAPVVRPSQAFRVFDTECGALSNQTETGIAIANPSPTDSVVVMLDVTDMNGTATPFGSTLTLPPLAHTAAFIKQLPGFQSIPDGFEGVVRIRTTSAAGITVVGMLGEFNARMDFVMAASIPVDETVPPSSATGLFPQLADGAGFETDFVLFSGSAGQASAGALKFFSPSGSPLN